MYKIFAKHGTSQKALVVCEKYSVSIVKERLSKKLGGKWVLVDKLQWDKREVLTFDDGSIYLGFDGRNEEEQRYCNGIESLKL